MPPAWEGAPRGFPAPLPGYLDAVLQAVAHRGAYLLVVAEQSGRNDGGAHRGAQGPARQSVLLGDPPSCSGAGPHRAHTGQAGSSRDTAPGARGRGDPRAPGEQRCAGGHPHLAGTGRSGALLLGSCCSAPAAVGSARLGPRCSPPQPPARPRDTAEPSTAPPGVPGSLLAQGTDR